MVHVVRSLAAVLCAALMAGVPAFPAGASGRPSPHAEPESPPSTLEGGAVPDVRSLVRSTTAVRPAIDEDFIVLGYVQQDEVRWGYHWHALTHVALPFTNFDSNGNISNPSSITGRSLIYRPGGMADRNGVKVIMTLRNSGFSLEILEAVMQDPARRAALVAQAAALINNPSDNIAGVNLDLEPSWSNTATRDGVYDFVRELRAALNPGKEISWYLEPQYNANRYGNIASVVDEVDFFNYSCYPWAGSWSTVAGSITRRNGYIGALDNFIAAGIPPEKIVLTLGAYGIRWQTTVNSGNPADSYGSPITSQIGSHGFADGKYETTVAPGAPERFLHTPSYSPYYATPISGNQFRTVVYEDEFSLELKMRDAHSWPGSQGTGRRMAGVGFWSLMWMSKGYFDGIAGQFPSHDMETNQSTRKFRTYPHVFQMMQEVFAPPGTDEYLIEKWEYFDNSLLGSFAGTTFQDVWDRWRDPGVGADNVGVASATRSIVPIPAGEGQPTNSAYGLRLDFSLNAVPGNRFLYRWEILGDYNDTTVRDLNAVRAVLPVAATVRADLHTAAPINGATIRFVLMDAKGELELGPAESLATTGWRTMEWDLTTGSRGGHATGFNQYRSGDGVIDTIPGRRDLAIVGFLVECGGNAAAGAIHLDELRWSTKTTAVATAPYLVNEFAFAGSQAEFVEIHGPVGTVPAGMELRFLRGSDGAVYRTVELGGTVIPAEGLLVVGTPASGASVTTGFSNGTNDIADDAPSAIQLINAATGEVHDSVVYRAFGGLGLLVSPITNGVTARGFPWMGDVRPGYSIGRHPDGANTGVNGRDFAVMPMSAGLPNGGSVALPATIRFESPTPGYYIAYDWAGAGPQLPPAGVGPSTDGGNALRVADSVGGNMAFIGDAALGAGGGPLEITGEIFVPTETGAGEAVGVGFFGRGGTTFFTNTPAGSGYESGYWLIYHNRGDVVINNGLGNHGGVFKFVLAQNDNMTPSPVVELGELPRTASGVATGTWAEFRFAINPEADELRAEIGGVAVYDGPIPPGAPASGAIQIGHRRTSGGTIPADSGTWVDGITVRAGGTLANVDAWMLLGL